LHHTSQPQAEWPRRCIEADSRAIEYFKCDMLDVFHELAAGRCGDSAVCEATRTNGEQLAKAASRRRTNPSSLWLA
jgi:hypothetical protein